MVGLGIGMGVATGDYASRYGPELITNGTFDSNVTGWTAQSGANVSWDAGTMLVANTPGDTFSGASQTITTEAGETYRIRVTVDATTGGPGIRVNDGPTAGGGLLFELIAVGQYEFTFAAASTQATIYATSSGDGASVNFDNISVQKQL